MNKVSLDLISRSVSFLVTEDARQHITYLAKPLQSARALLTIVETPSTIEEIAEHLDLSVGTVNQIVNALVTGGCPLHIDRAGTQGRRYIISIDPNPK